MKPNMDSFIKESVPNQTQANELMGRMFTAAQPGSLFSQPVVQGEYAVVMASEMIGGLGYGFGGGGGNRRASRGWLGRERVWRRRWRRRQHDGPAGGRHFHRPRRRTRGADYGPHQDRHRLLHHAGGDSRFLRRISRRVEELK